MNNDRPKTPNRIQPLVHVMNNDRPNTPMNNDIPPPIPKIPLKNKKDVMPAYRRPTKK